MYRDVGMAMPKSTETRCTDSSVQARQVVKRLHKQPHPYIFFLYLKFCEFSYEITGSSMCSKKKDVGMGLLV